MKQIIFLIGFLALHYTGAIAQTKRALVIGINTYEAPANYHTKKTNVRVVQDLHGCVNDAKSIYEKLHLNFGFDTANIDTLYNTDATRKAIMQALKKICDDSKEGDLAVLYYSGHGSHVKNSLSNKIEKQDQTIVPSDTYVDSVHDIRGPELNQYFNLFVDKKVKLTVIFDCCESGSLARGPNAETAKPRFLESENWDALDSSHYPAPEYRPGGYCMIMYASRSFEPAVEDEFDSVYHGAFTYSLLKSINGQSVNASANSIFQSARSILKNLPKPQEPLISGDPERLNETLFGLKRDKSNIYEGFEVEDISSLNIENNEFTIRVGFANQVSKKTQLVAMYDSSKFPLTLEIVSVLGLNSSVAKCIQGDSNSIKAGTIFRISNLVADEEKLMKIFIPSSKSSPNKFNQFIREVLSLKASKKVRWIGELNPMEKGPFATVFWKDQLCYLKLDTLKAIVLPDFSAKIILDLCSKQIGFQKDSSIYVEMPIASQISEAIINKLQKQASPYFQLVSDIRKAQYTLYSNLLPGNMLAYGFRRTVISKAVDLDPLPFKTNMNISTVQSLTQDDSLYMYLNKLAKIYYWTNLTYPIDDNQFLYQVVLFKRDSLNPILNNQFVIGDKLTISLIKAGGQEEQESIPPNYYHISLFRIAPDGDIHCVEETDNNLNSFPKPGELFDQKKIDIKNINTGKYMSGVYTYFLVASHEPYDFCKEIEQSAVFDRTKIGARGAGSSKQYVQKISFLALNKTD